MTTVKSSEVLAAYASFFKNWPSKFVGEKPTAEMIDTYHKLGARHGKQCLAGAMALRPEGVTGAEIVMVCSAPQLNKMRGFIADALVKRLPDAGSRNGGFVYKLVVTPKGLKRIETSTAKMAKLEAAGNVTETEKPKAVKKLKGAALAKAKKSKAATEAALATIAAPVTETEAVTEQPQT